MVIREFLVETWLNPRVECKYNFGSSGVKAFVLEELFACIGLDANVFIEEMRRLNLHYGHFFGLQRLRDALGGLYRHVSPDGILTMHGGTGANNAVIMEFANASGNVVALVPNYQQHYSIPESLGAEVRYLRLREENGWLPDLDELASLIDDKTTLLTLSNPNNPSGSFIDEATMRKICALADKVGAYVLSDEIYRGLDDAYMPSAADIYDRGIATCSTSKVFSMAGTRIGWIATRDRATYKRLENRRSYDTICCGVFDELITAIALERQDRILARNREIVRTNRAILDDWLRTQPHLRCANKSFSPIAFLGYDFEISGVDLCTEIYEKTGTLLCHGDCFDVPKSFRLGYGYVEPALLSEGLGVLGDYFEKMAG